MDLVIDAFSSTPGADAVEIVERKGLGHPDTMSDALAEALSKALCRYYLDRFGVILHHNVDKVLLWGGSARPAFGGGEMLAPIEIYLSGRAVTRAGGVDVPIDEIAGDCVRQWIADNIIGLDPERHVRLHCLVRPGSVELSQLFERQRKHGIALANDTSCGVGYAPTTHLEDVVLEVERRLNAPSFRRMHPAHGEDVKVMGVTSHGQIRLTVARAIVGRHVRDLNHYLALKGELAADVQGICRQLGATVSEVEVNAADDPAAGAIYLTVTGTSAEAGDDGQAGRGNRANGLITPYRPMSIESVAGKNPVTHVGKLYNIAAGRIAAAIVAEIPEVARAQCVLVSRIGHRIDDPQIAHLRIGLHDNGRIEVLRPHIARLVEDGLAELATIWKQILAGEISLF
ncbi:MAG: methionine adenosyltransferase [Alphaproteobacteria bacterium]